MRLVQSGTPRFSAYSYLTEEIGVQPSSQRIHSLAVIPILYEGRALGALNLGSYSAEPMDEHRRNVLVSLGAHVGAALARDLALEELREREANLTTLFDSIDDFLWVLDGQGQVIRTNATVPNRLGYAPHEVAYRSLLEFHPEGRREEAAQIVMEMLQGKRDYCPVPLRKVDGSEIPVETRIAPGTWNGKPALFGVSRDITARIASEQALRESEQKFRLLAEKTSDGLIFIRGDRVDYVSPAFLTIFGYAESEVVGLTMAEVFQTIDAEDRERVRKAVRDTLRAGAPEVTYAYRIERGGQVRWREDHARFVYDAAGRYQDTFVVSRDITERVRAEHEREQLREQLQQAMKMEAVGRLAGGVAHDFNNLLTSISGNVQLVIDELEPEHSANELLADVAEAARLASDLTRQLLAFSRKQIIEPKVLHINSIVGTFRKMIARMLGEDITLEVHLDPEVGAVRMDEAQFEQVLINLAVNARDAMPQGGSLSILTRSEPARESDCSSGRYAVLEVRDTGHGMDEEVQKHLFEPFFTTKGVGKGTGLGLATLYGAVTQAGGYVRVQSKEGFGSTFFVYLPCADREEAPVEAAAGARAQGGHERILLVEDDALVRRIAVKALERVGYTVYQAEDGVDAQSLLSRIREPIDLVVTDVVMPRMGGRAFAQWLATAFPQTQVLFTSGYAEGEIATQGVLQTDIAFLAKPYTPQDLAAKVREVLGRGSP